MDKERKKLSEKRRSRYRLLYKLEGWLEAPMFVLAILWLFFFILELVKGLTPTQQQVITLIWILFIFEFLLKLYLAPRKRSYLTNSWITIIALIIPALRVFRLFAALRILRTARVISTTRIVRALTSTRRFIKNIEQVQGPKPEAVMNVGMVIAASSASKVPEMQDFAKTLGADVESELAAATGINWEFHQEEPFLLNDDDARMASDFLDEGSMYMAEGSYDSVVIITDVALISREKSLEAGLPSIVTRVVVISTRKLVSSPRGMPAYSLELPEVRWNAAALLLHLMGHIGGLKHKRGVESKVMAPFHIDLKRNTAPQFNNRERKLLKKRSDRLPERELHGGNILESFIFHLIMSFRNFKDVTHPLVRNSALLLPLSLPGLATAAVAPSFLLVFSAEIWDVGLNMANTITIIYAIISIMAASFYLVRVQSLFLPRKEKRILTEHLAVANSVIFLSILFACIGLFIMVGALIFLVEVYIFPEGLMKTWPTLLNTSEIRWTDKLKLAAFISTVGVTTGALAGGFESRKVIQHLALFEKEV